MYVHGMLPFSRNDLLRQYIHCYCDCCTTYGPWPLCTYSAHSSRTPAEHLNRPASPLQYMRILHSSWSTDLFLVCKNYDTVSLPPCSHFLLPAGRIQGHTHPSHISLQTLTPILQKSKVRAQVGIDSKPSSQEPTDCDLVHVEERLWLSHSCIFYRCSLIIRPLPLFPSSYSTVHPSSHLPTLRYTMEPSRRSLMDFSLLEIVDQPAAVFAG